MSSKKTGVLLLNLGTPSGPDPKNVGIYLKEFLMDKYVIDIPYPLRWFLVKVLIVPKRKFASSHAYQQIWDPKRGSPLLYLTEDLTKKMADGLGADFDVRFAMRYGTPSIESVLKSWSPNNLERLVVLPLYPQYAESSTRSCLEEFQRVYDQLNWNLKVDTIQDFYDHPAFVGALSKTARLSLSGKSFDKILFSFHGLPEKHLKKLPIAGGQCSFQKSCCDQVTAKNRDCYRAQCFATARALAKEMDLSEDQYVVAFQSRLGRAEWIKPYSDKIVEALPPQGVKKLAILSPSFVTDCLETIEEIGIRAKESFLTAGGEEFHFVPSHLGDGFQKIIQEFVSKKSE